MAAPLPPVIRPVLESVALANEDVLLLPGTTSIPSGPMIVPLFARDSASGH